MFLLVLGRVLYIRRRWHVKDKQRLSMQAALRDREAKEQAEQERANAEALKRRREEETHRQEEEARKRARDLDLLERRELDRRRCEAEAAEAQRRETRRRIDAARLKQLEDELHRRFAVWLMTTYLEPPSPIPNDALTKFMDDYAAELPPDAGLMRASQDGFTMRCVMCATSFPPRIAT